MATQSSTWGRKTLDTTEQLSTQPTQTAYSGLNCVPQKRYTGVLTSDPEDVTSVVK